MSLPRPLTPAIPAVFPLTRGLGPPPSQIPRTTLLPEPPSRLPPDLPGHSPTSFSKGPDCSRIIPPPSPSPKVPPSTSPLPNSGPRAFPKARLSSNPFSSPPLPRPTPFPFPGPRPQIAAPSQRWRPAPDGRPGVSSSAARGNGHLHGLRRGGPGVPTGRPPVAPPADAVPRGWPRRGLWGRRLASVSVAAAPGSGPGPGPRPAGAAAAAAAQGHGRAGLGAQARGSGAEYDWARPSPLPLPRAWGRAPSLPSRPPSVRPPAPPRPAPQPGAAIALLAPAAAEVVAPVEASARRPRSELGNRRTRPAASPGPSPLPRPSPCAPGGTALFPLPAPNLPPPLPLREGQTRGGIRGRGEVSGGRVHVSISRAPLPPCCSVFYGASAHVPARLPRGEGAVPVAPTLSGVRPCASGGGVWLCVAWSCVSRSFRSCKSDPGFRYSLWGGGGLFGSASPLVWWCRGALSHLGLGRAPPPPCAVLPSVCLPGGSRPSLRPQPGTDGPRAVSCPVRSRLSQALLAPPSSSPSTLRGVCVVVHPRSLSVPPHPLLRVTVLSHLPPSTPTAPGGRKSTILFTGGVCLRFLSGSLCDHLFFVSGCIFEPHTPPHGVMSGPRVSSSARSVCACCQFAESVSPASHRGVGVGERGTTVKRQGG